MSSTLPPELGTNLSDASRASVAQWWSDLSQGQKDAVQQLLAFPECTVYASRPDDPVASAAVDFFDDDWQQNWETDWREYLTEHPDVRLVTLDFLCYTVRCG